MSEILTAGIRTTSSEMRLLQEGSEESFKAIWFLNQPSGMIFQRGNGLIKSPVIYTCLQASAPIAARTRTLFITNYAGS